MFPILEKIGETGILPVIKVEKRKHAKPLANALMNGGVSAIEITLRSEAALDSIRDIKEAFPQMAVGAGTVLTTAQIDAAVEAGADYIVTPGFNPENVEYCIKNGIPITPGAVTASDIELGISMGLDVFKYFPAEQMGGLQAMQLLSGPFSKVKFIPTGGLNFNLLPQYLAKDFVLACGGSYMANSDLIRQEKWTEIEQLSKKALEISMGFELSHIGINHENEEQAAATANWFNSAFNMANTNHTKSIFAGKAVECMKEPFYGTKGHIGFSTISMRRALPYLRSKGFKFREESLVTDANGTPKWIYFADEIGGFAVHIVQR